MAGEFSQPTARTAGSPSVVVVGSVNVDLTVHVDRWLAPGETALGESLTVMSGGKGANQAVAAARMGADVALVGAVGKDEYEAVALRCLREAGVDLSAVGIVDTSTGIAVITVGPDGDNIIVVVPGANTTVTAETVREQAALIGGAAVVVLQMETSPSAICEVVRVARGRLVINYGPIVEIDPDVLLAADPLVVNEHEAAAAAALLATGHPVAQSLEPGEEEPCVRELLAAGVRSVVVTLGERGAVVCAGAGQPIVALPAEVVKAVDTTGAGDAFVGALAASLAEGADLVAASRAASRVAAYSVQRPGAQASYPDRKALGVG